MQEKNQIYYDTDARRSDTTKAKLESHTGHYPIYAKQRTIRQTNKLSSI